MSQLMPRKAVINLDPLTEHLQNLQPDQVDALQMMQGVYSNQVALSSTVISLQHQAINSDNDVHGLAESVAVNALAKMDELTKEIKEQTL